MGWDIFPITSTLGYLDGLLSDQQLLQHSFFGVCYPTALQVYLYLVWFMVRLRVVGRHYGLLSFGQSLVRVTSCINRSLLLMLTRRLIIEDDIPLSTTLFGYLLLSRGIGNIASTPISNALLRNNQTSPVSDNHSTTGFAVGEGKFENVILYVGACFATASAIAMAGWGLEKSRARRAHSTS